MLIQRRPSASTTSTLGVSGSATRAMPSGRERAWRRRGGRGSLGMTEGLVDGRDHDAFQSTARAAEPTPQCAGLQPQVRLLWFRPHSCTRPEGWRDWPDETPATPAQAGRCQFLETCGVRAPSSSHEVSRRRTRSFSMAVTHLACRECGAEYDLTAQYVCHRCFGPLEAKYDHSALAADPAALRRRIQGGPQNIWRYVDFLPLVDGQPGPSARNLSRVGLPAGCTPLVRADRLAERLGLNDVWVKNDAHNPTRSFKDRVVSVAAARARELGFDTLACASTGNLANAVAAAAAALGMPSYVFIPADLEEQRILATGVYGTNLIKVRGNYDDVNRLCTEVSGEQESWAFVNVNMRPYYAEGSKTLAYEIAEQLGFRTPDRIVAPIASGSLYTKIAKGFDEWRELGLVEGDAPTMNGAQALGCSPVATAFAAGTDVCRPVKPDTIAKSLAIGNPADGPYAVELAN